ncbi:MAG: hypothetical protein GX974_04105, partial [Clostridiales bacterium]|nr:hypothetical protein [Clostridiales bacterium]
GENSVKITFKNGLGADIFIPIITSDEDIIEGTVIKKGEYCVSISSDAGIIGGRRIFNLVPGFMAAEYKVEDTECETTIVIDVD